MVRSLSLLLRGRKRAGDKKRKETVTQHSQLFTETVVISEPPTAVEQPAPKNDELQFPFLERTILGKVERSKRRWSSSSSGSDLLCGDIDLYHAATHCQGSDVEVRVEDEVAPSTALTTTLRTISEWVTLNWQSDLVLSRNVNVVHEVEASRKSWSLYVNGKQLFSVVASSCEASILTVELRVFDEEVANAMSLADNAFDPHYFAIDHFLSLTTCLVLQAPLEMFAPRAHPALIVVKIGVVIIDASRTFALRGFGAHLSSDEEEEEVPGAVNQKTQSPFLAEVEFSGRIGVDDECWEAMLVVSKNEDDSVHSITATGPWRCIYHAMEQFRLPALVKHASLLRGDSSTLVRSDDRVSLRCDAKNWAFVDVGRHTVGLNAEHEYLLVCSGRTAVICKDTELIARFEVKRTLGNSARGHEQHRRGETTIVTHACETFAHDIGKRLTIEHGSVDNVVSVALLDFLRDKLITPFFSAWVVSSGSIGPVRRRRSAGQKRSFATLGCQVTCKDVSAEEDEHVVLSFVKSCAEGVAGMVSIFGEDCLQSYKLLPPQRLIIHKMPRPSVFQVVDEPIESHLSMTRTTPHIYALWVLDSDVVYMSLHPEASSALFVVVHLRSDSRVVETIRWTCWRGRTSSFTKGCVSPKSDACDALYLHNFSIDGPCGTRIFTTDESSELNPIGMDQFSLTLYPTKQPLEVMVPHPTMPAETVSVRPVLKETLAFTSLLTKSGRDPKDTTLHRTVEVVLNGGLLAWKGGAKSTSSTTGLDTDGASKSNRFAPNTRHSKRSMIKLSESGYLVYKVCATRRNEACLVTLYVPPISAVATAGDSKYRFSDVLVVAMDLIPCLEINGGKPWADFTPPHPELLTLLVDASSIEGKTSKKAVRAAKKKGLMLRKTSSCAACGGDKPEVVEEKEPWMTYEPCAHSGCFKCYIGSVALMTKSAHPTCLVCNVNVAACRSTKADDTLDIWRWSLADVEKFAGGGPTEALPPVYRRTGTVYRLGARMHAADFSMDLNAVCMGGFHACLTPKPAIEGFGDFEGRMPWYAPKVESIPQASSSTSINVGLDEESDTRVDDDILFPVIDTRKAPAVSHESMFEKTPLMLPAVASSSRVYPVVNQDTEESVTLTGDVTVTHSKIPATHFDGSADAYLKSVSFLQASAFGDVPSSSSAKKSDVLADWLNQSESAATSSTPVFSSSVGPSFDAPWEETDKDWAHFPDVPEHTPQTQLGEDDAGRPTKKSTTRDTSAAQ